MCYKYLIASIYSSRLVAKFINSILIVVCRCSIDEISKNFVQRFVKIVHGNRQDTLVRRCIILEICF